MNTDVNLHRFFRLGEKESQWEHIYIHNVYLKLSFLNAI